MVHSQEDDDILGQYTFAFVDLDNHPTLKSNSMAQQAKLRMVIEEVTRPTYVNGVYKINE